MNKSPTRAHFSGEAEEGRLHRTLPSWKIVAGLLLLGLKFWFGSWFGGFGHGSLWVALSGRLRDISTGDRASMWHLGPPF